MPGINRINVLLFLYSTSMDGSPWAGFLSVLYRPLELLPELMPLILNKMYGTGFERNDTSCSYFLHKVCSILKTSLK